MTIQRILLLFPPEEKNILRAIKAINENFGWVSDEAIGKIARYFNKSESHIFSVASFYDEINLNYKPVPVSIEICDGANCQTKSADELIRKIESFLKIKVDGYDRNFSLKKMSCVGRCVEGPVVKINGVIYTRMTADKVIALIQSKFGY
jgi:NADH:ubiquinone oxidoreductase subunit E